MVSHQQRTKGKEKAYQTKSCMILFEKTLTLVCNFKYSLQKFNNNLFENASWNT